MIVLSIPQSTFEELVPAFRDCESQIYESIAEYMANVEQTVYDELSISPVRDAADVDSYSDYFIPYICKRTAYEALPHLDLVLTANGFAVVGNQNFTPASRQRVYDLRERLRREKSDARDALLRALLFSDWWSEQQMRIKLSSLLWCPTLLRKYGVRTRDGNPIYEEELQFVQADLNAAQHLAEMMVGEEQMSELLQVQHLEDDSAESMLVERCRRLMASYLKGADLRLAKHEVQDFLNRNADSLPTYKASSKYEADHFKPYENRKNDSTFFFG